MNHPSFLTPRLAGTLLLALGMTFSTPAAAENDSIPAKKDKPHLTLGGYGEVVFSRNFHSDNIYRY